jgi:hypothetical protein
MQPDDYIKMLYKMLNELLSEDKLQKAIFSSLEELRKLYRKNPSLFSQRHIQLLKNIRIIADTIDDFINLTYGIKDISNFNDYNYVLGELRNMKEILKGFAIEKRIDKEIRSLLQAAPQINKKEHKIKRS